MDASAALKPGAAVAVELVDGRALRGFVHAADVPAGLVCLEVVPGGDVAVLRIGSVKAVDTRVSLGVERKWPAKPALDTARLRAEQERVFRKHAEEFANIGMGVSESAQAIFNTLAKTLPCKWERDVIVVLGTVYVAPPYSVDSIKSHGDANAANRVKMIIEREARAIWAAADTNGATT